MRTHHRRSTAFAATCATVIGGIVLLGGSPAAAAAPDSTVSDCATTSSTPDGMLDAGLLQACLDEIQAASQSPLSADAAFAPDAEAMIDAELAFEAPAFETPVFETPTTFETPTFETVAEIAPAGVPTEAVPEAEPASEEAAPADEGGWAGGAWAALRDCESGGDYGINTGNGYYGAYQFALSTWEGLGYGGYPHEASPAVQDQAAAELQALYGWRQWPACSWYLGL
jgi:hypothetical protein